MKLEKKIKKRTSTLEMILAAIPEGRPIALSYARQIAIHDERFGALMRDYDSDETQDLGDLCHRHKIEPPDFMAEVNKMAFPYTEESMKLAHSISTQLVAKRLPKVVERGMIEGAKATGVTDRHFILQKQGFHTAPKGTTINMNQLNQQQAGLPTFEEETKSLNDILQVEEDHLLTEGAIEADFNEVEEEKEVA